MTSAVSLGYSVITSCGESGNHSTLLSAGIKDTAVAMSFALFALKNVPPPSPAAINNTGHFINGNFDTGELKYKSCNSSKCLSKLNFGV